MFTLLRPSLSDLCNIRIAYSLWTRRDVTRKRLKDQLFDSLVDLVSADVQNLPLPKELKSRILDIVRPVGKRLVNFVKLWLRKTQPGNCPKWLTGEMLFECLVLNEDGLISERKTAEKILRTRVLHKYAAFRLACVNFLEDEVLKLWILVKQGILSKIAIEGSDPLRFSELYSYRFISKENNIPNRNTYPYTKIEAELPPFPCTEEADEVLFWIGFCLSKEKAIDMREVPHFAGKDVDWHEYAVLQSAAYPSNLACLQYATTFDKWKVTYYYAGMLKLNTWIDYSNCEQHCFVYHFRRLDSQEKADLFRDFPINMVTYFLQWPLSQTFLENMEEILNLIPERLKSWVFLKVFMALFHENPLLNPITDDWGYLCGSEGFRSIIHSVEHLKRIWMTLWEISEDCYKLKFLNTYVFESITRSKRCTEFVSRFESSGLRDKLLRLFLSNGETVLELYEGESIKESLQSLVKKHMPRESEHLHNSCLSYLIMQTKRYRRRMKREMKEKVISQGTFSKRECKSRSNPIHEDFFNYIRKEIE